jgi:hypothetical protein
MASRQHSAEIIDWLWPIAMALRSAFAISPGATFGIEWSPQSKKIQAKQKPFDDLGAHRRRTLPASIKED